MSDTAAMNPGSQGDAMPMKFRCTACTARLHVPSRWAGTTIECPKCMTRVVVPVEAPGAQPVRFEDRSIEKRIEAFEAATIAAATAVATGVSNPCPTEADGSPARTGRDSGGRGKREGMGRGMIAVPTSWIVIVAAAVVVAIVAAAVAGFWAGWLASRPPAK